MFASGKTAAVASAANYIEEVFSTYLYAGNGSTQNITNSIDLAGKGGLVWTKARITNSNGNHLLVDTSRGAGYRLQSNTTDAQYYNATAFVTNFNSNGYSIGDGYQCNESPTTYASWTFRKQPKFFDVVTYTGTSGTQVVSHNLGSVPGCLIMRATSTSGSWIVNHRSLATGYSLILEESSAASSGSSLLQNATSTTFEAPSYVNQSGVTYVAYLFAHNAGGFGLTGTDNVISCGSFTTDSGGNATVSLGYEPTWVMFKCSSNAGQNWEMLDTMRGWSMSTDVAVQANSAAAEAPGGYGNPTATGFVMGGQGNTHTYIYIAIRRGPMKVPTSGTSVFSPVAQTKSSFPSTVTAGFPVDLTIEANRASDGLNSTAIDRLRGGSVASITSGTAAEYGSAGCSFASNTVFSDGWLNNTSNIYWMFRRAPSFFDEVCYTGTGSATTFSHNLTVAPEMMIVKSRSGNVNWAIYTASTGATKWMYFGTAGASTLSSIWNDTAPTSSVFTIGSASPVNDSAATYVAYLFATCAGVSKCTAFTGTGTLQTINCGFTSGARFVLVKRTDSTGDWYVWDSARGISSSTDPYLLLNSTAAEVTSTNWVDTTSTGFQVTAASGNNVNINGASYIALAIA